MAQYLYLIDVRCTAPANYKPRVSTYKVLAISMHKNISDKLKDEAIRLVEKALTAENPGIPLKFSASVDVRKKTFCIDIDDQLAGIETIEIPLIKTENNE